MDQFCSGDWSHLVAYTTPHRNTPQTAPVFHFTVVASLRSISRHAQVPTIGATRDTGLKAPLFIQKRSVVLFESTCLDTIPMLKL